MLTCTRPLCTRPLHTLHTRPPLRRMTPTFVSASKVSLTLLSLAFAPPSLALALALPLSLSLGRARARTLSLSLAGTITHVAHITLNPQPQTLTKHLSGA